MSRRVCGGGVLGPRPMRQREPATEAGELVLGHRHATAVADRARGDDCLGRSDHDALSGPSPQQVVGDLRDGHLSFLPRDLRGNAGLHVLLRLVRPRAVEKGPHRLPGPGSDEQRELLLADGLGEPEFAEEGAQVVAVQAGDPEVRPLLPLADQRHRALEPSRVFHDAHWLGHHRSYRDSRGCPLGDLDGAQGLLDRRVVHRHSLGLLRRPIGAREPDLAHPHRAGQQERDGCRVEAERLLHREVV
mmetsp:Transcript_78525/g.197320  ORF Transcript_78525/g.197320 Transcript_78525/m.197320 type:complete len:246 (-) Transcript_78525:315-1052(-)